MSFFKQEDKCKAVKVYILSRVSHKDQEDNYSLDAQEKILEKYCESKGLEVVDRVRLVESSTKGNRVEFYDLLSKIKKNKEIIGIVVDCVDRLQRSFTETVELGKLAREGKIELHFRRENIIINKDANSTDFMMWNFAVMMAEAYVLQLSENVKRGNGEKFERGEIAGKAPFGYINTRDSKDNAWVEVDGTKREFINWIFNAYDSGDWSFNLLAEEGVRRGYFKASKSGRFRATKVAQILKNPFYCGILRRNGREIEHAYETLISKNLFYSVQDKIALNARKKKKNNSIPYIFNHVFRCEDCDSAIVGINPKKDFRYYRCSNAKCSNYRINKSEKELLSELSTLFARGILSDEVIEKVVSTLKKSVDTKYKVQIETLNSLNAKKKSLVARMDNMYLDRLDGRITVEKYDSLHERQVKQLNEVDVQISKVSQGQENFYITAEMVLKLISNSKQIFQKATISEKQNLIKLISYNSKAKGREYTLTLRQPFKQIFESAEETPWQG